MSEEELFDDNKINEEEQEDQEELDRIARKEQEDEKLRVVEKDVMAWAEAKQKRAAKAKKRLGEIDKQLRTGLSLILNYYAEQQVFNQQLLEDLVPIIAKRSAILKKVK